MCNSASLEPNYIAEILFLKNIGITKKAQK